MSEHTAQSLYEGVKRLLASAKDDYENKRWDNHSYYVKKFNEFPVPSAISVSSIGPSLPMGSRGLMVFCSLNVFIRNFI